MVCLVVHSEVLPTQIMHNYLLVMHLDREAQVVIVLFF